MNLPLRTPLRHRKSLLFWASASLAAVAGLLPRVRADVTASVDKGQSATQHKTVAPAGGAKNSGRTSTTDSVSGNVFYTITVRNLSAGPAQGVTVEYHIFNKTTTSSSRAPSSVSVDDITASSTLDLDPNGIKTIETTDIPKGSKNTVTSGNTSKKGVSTPGFTSSTNTSVMGWVVYIKKGDKVIHAITSTDTVLDDVEKIKKSSGA